MDVYEKRRLANRLRTVLPPDWYCPALLGDPFVVVCDARRKVWIHLYSGGCRIPQGVPKVVRDLATKAHKNQEGSILGAVILERDFRTQALADVPERTLKFLPGDQERPFRWVFSIAQEYLKSWGVPYISREEAQVKREAQRMAAIQASQERARREVEEKMRQVEASKRRRESWKSRRGHDQNSEDEG